MARVHGGERHPGRRIRRASISTRFQQTRDVDRDHAPRRPHPHPTCSRAELALAAKYADCLEPLVDARRTARPAVQAAFTAEHQASIDRYLRDAPHSSGASRSDTTSGTPAHVPRRPRPRLLRCHHTRRSRARAGWTQLVRGDAVALRPRRLRRAAQSGRHGPGDRSRHGRTRPFTPSDYCYQAANLSPSPAGTLTTNLAVASNGVLHPDYFRRINTGSGQVTMGTRSTSTRPSRSSPNNELLVADVEVTTYRWSLTQIAEPID